VEYRQQAQPLLVVLADRTGADIVAISGTGEQAVDEVNGMPEEFPVHKAKAGGWSQKRHQQRVENTWDKNAAEAAEHVSKIAERIGARMIAGAGDPRALQLLQEHLPSEIAERFRMCDGTAASLDHVADEVTRLVADESARDTVALLEQFRNAKGQGDLACEGVADTLRALAEARVETLLVHDDPDDGRRALFGPRPEVVGTDRATLDAMGAPEVAEGRLADVAIRAALGTDAAVRIIPGHGGPAEGIGAVLRWANG
jgi:peptide subunit release factor 1 (eRF1)